MFFSDDQGDTDPNVVILDGYVDVLYTNFSSPTKPFALIDNADAYVGPLPSCCSTCWGCALNAHFRL